jgi:hypothetical protein
MDASKRRLFVVAGHFDAGRRSEQPGSVATQQLQELLDHDNIELRKRMKEFMKDDIYIPWVARPRLPPRHPSERCARRARAPRWCRVRWAATYRRPAPATEPPATATASPGVGPLLHAAADAPPAPPPGATTSTCATTASWRCSGSRSSACRASSRSRTSGVWAGAALQGRAEPPCPALPSAPTPPPPRPRAGTTRCASSRRTRSRRCATPAWRPR